MRSTGACAVDDNSKILGFELIKSKPNEGKTKKQKNNNIPILNDEELIIYNSGKVVQFVERMSETNGLDIILIEGLSFGSLSGNRDLIDGNFWGIRVGLKKKFPFVPIEIITVQSWRNKILNKQDRKEAKEKYSKQLWTKKAVVDKLTDGQKEMFKNYIKKNGFEPTGLYDLADSYSIAKYWIGQHHA